jgi:hypothetical protein
LGETIGRGCAEACERYNKKKESGKGRGRQVIAVTPWKEDKGKHSATVCERNRGRRKTGWSQIRRLGERSQLKEQPHATEQNMNKNKQKVEAVSLRDPYLIRTVQRYIPCKRNGDENNKGIK